MTIGPMTVVAFIVVMVCVVLGLVDYYRLPLPRSQPQFWALLGILAWLMLGPAIGSALR